jgi:putative transcriptional regulator
MKTNVESLLKIGENWLNPKKGRVLISEPFASDMIFKKSVVYIVEHSENNTMGFILNKRVNIETNPFFRVIGVLPFELSFGGPVGVNRILFLHTLGLNVIPGSKEIADGIFLGGNYKVVREKLDSGEISDRDVRFFIGCAGWSPKQLENEINSKFWVVGNLDKSIIMDFHSDIWGEAVKSLGGKYALWKNLPEDPSLN